MIIARSPLDLVVLLHPATEKSWFRVKLNKFGNAWRLCPRCAVAMYNRLYEDMVSRPAFNQCREIEHDFGPTCACDGCMSLEGSEQIKHQFLKGWMRACKD